MTDCTQEEKDLIAGQLYFFRAWWHFECMMYLGGLPYVTTVLDAASVPRLSRLSFQECADSCAKDLRRAADLLPIDWDDTSAGQATKGHNQRRINKIMALGYLGKVYLWSASPLMKHGAMTGAGNLTYDYDTDRCQKAAEAFGELLNLVESGQTQYALAEFNYSDIYTHTKSPDATTCYSEIWFTQGQSWVIPGSTEAIMYGGDGGVNASPWGFSISFGPIDLTTGGNVHHPTANYVNYAYGMANGLPIDDPESGFDPTHPSAIVIPVSITILCSMVCSISLVRYLMARSRLKTIVMPISIRAETIVRIVKDLARVIFIRNLPTRIIT